MRINDPVKIVRITTVSTLVIIVAWELFFAVMPLKPFWVDEWRVVYNLKFKTFVTIWGPMDYMQQFPRVYLFLVKYFASLFNYNYFSLRFPSFVLGTLSIFLVYNLMNRLYSREHFNRFLFVMILISSCTFTNYYVQIKQYTMDMLLSLVALWQCMGLLSISGGARLNYRRYSLLCISFLAVPFFSYTYPIAVAPVFIVVAAQSIYQARQNGINAGKRTLLLRWAPLCCCAAAIVAFYFVDVAQLMADKNMHQYWGTRMRCEGYTWMNFFINFYNLFAEIGAGVLFWFIFGTMGVASFLYGIYKCSVNFFRKKDNSFGAAVLLYSVSLVVLVILLSLSGKFPVGEPRLNAFTVPAISILIIYLLDELKKTKLKAFSHGLSVLLYLGVTGNIYTTFYAEVTGPVYARKMEIYRATEKGIALAQEKRVPILITPGVAFPYDTTQNLPFNTRVPGDWVLKTFPAYDVRQGIPVIGIPNLSAASAYLDSISPAASEAVAGDGRSFRMVGR